MTLLTGWPTLVDDSGDGTSGTVVDKSVFDDIKAAIEAVTHSTTNTTVNPNDTTDEVVTARGNLASLNARLSGVVDDDGALITPASIISTAQLQAAIGRVNLLANDTFLMWSGGDDAAPDYWVHVDGGTSVIDRAGASQSDTAQRVGLYCLSLTNACEMYQEFVPAAAWSRFEWFEGQKVSMGAWVKSGVASHARLQVDDGGTTTSSDYHTGAGDWEWLTVTHTVAATATHLRAQLDVAQNGTAYFSGVTCLLGDQPVDEWVPCPKVYGAIVLGAPGTVTVADDKDWAALGRPAFIKEVQCYVNTSPGFIIDASNAKIDITEGSSGDAVATIVSGTYASGTALATAVATALNAAATDNTWTCTYSTSTGKFTIGHDAVQTGALEWNTGSSTANSAGDILGFNTDADDTGASSYVGDTDTRTETGLTIDIEVGDGASSYNSIFSAAKFVIGNGYKFGTVTPDGTYRYLTIPSDHTNAAATGAGIIRLNVDQSQACADLKVFIRALQYNPPLEDFYAADVF
jgi:hypothetical protein